MRIEMLKVTGMTCDGCVAKLTKALKAIQGVGDVNVSLSTETVMVDFDEQLTLPEQLKLAVQGAGYGVGTSTAQKPQGK